MVKKSLDPDLIKMDPKHWVFYIVIAVENIFNITIVVYDLYRSSFYTSNKGSCQVKKNHVINLSRIRIRTTSTF